MKAVKEKRIGIWNDGGWGGRKGDEQEGEEGGGEVELKKEPMINWTKTDCADLNDKEKVDELCYNGKLFALGNETNTI